MTVHEPSPRPVKALSPRQRRVLFVSAAVGVVLLAAVAQGCVVAVERSVALASYQKGTLASTIIAEMGPPDADFVPRADERHLLGEGVARALFYDTAPWWAPFLVGVSLEFDGDDRLLMTWDVVE
ncbi:MAG: hypothetical protein AB7U83_17875 [Vicinamibacterales bacterium]